MSSSRLMENGNEHRIVISVESEKNHRYNHLESVSSNSSTTSSQTSTKNDKLERTLTRLSLIVALLSFGTSVSLLVRRFLPRPATFTDPMCLPCTKLQQSMDFENDNRYESLSKKVEYGERICCAYSSIQTENMFDLISQLKIKEFEYFKKNNQTVIDQGLVSAHILIEKDKGQAVLREERDLSHVNGLKILHNQLLIPKKGRYYLYSHIDFKLLHDTGNYNISHQIKKMELNGGKVEPILMNSYNMTLDKNYFRTSIISGIFNLKAGDLISLELNQVSYMSNIPTNNFIGLIYMGV